MDSREIKEAGNALVHWCNSQELTPRESLLVMRKVMAKIIARDVTTIRDIQKIIADFSIDLTHDVIERVNPRD